MQHTGIVINTELISFGFCDLVILNPNNYTSVSTNPYIIIDSDLARRILAPCKSEGYSRVFKLNSRFDNLDEIAFIQNHLKYMIVQYYDEEYSVSFNNVFLLFDTEDIGPFKQYIQRYIPVKTKQDTIKQFPVSANNNGIYHGPTPCFWSETENEIIIEWIDFSSDQYRLDKFKKNGSILCIR